MKQILLTLTLGAMLTAPAWAQTNTDAPPPPPPPDGPPGEHHPGMDFLTDAEKQELHKAHDAAEAADPSLATEEKSLMAGMESSRDSGQPPSKDDMEKMRAFHDKMDAAMIKADPAVAPIIAKLKAHHHHHDGPPPPPPSDT
jgi:Spy/CpxP family protein refolding chaperone